MRHEFINCSSFASFYRKKFMLFFRILVAKNYFEKLVFLFYMCYEILSYKLFILFSLQILPDGECVDAPIAETNYIYSLT